METIYDIAGLIGVVFYLSAYALLQLGKLRGSGYVYTLMNLTAASLVLLSLAENFNLSSAIIQTSWIVLSVIGITRMWLHARQLRFSEEEEELIAQRFATMPRADARRVLSAGRWQDGHAGEVLTVQGAPVQQLVYLAQGTAQVEVDGRVIAEVPEGGFVGEMGCLDSDEATATVRLGGRGRYFAITSDALRDLVRRHAELGPHIDYAFAASTRAKLVATNSRLHRALGDEDDVEAQVRALTGQG